MLIEVEVVDVELWCSFISSSCSSLYLANIAERAMHFKYQASIK
jgi:hypothetical protein